MMTITTDTAELFSHQVYFVLTATHASTLSYSAELISMGKLKYEFDVPNSGTEVTNVGIRGGSMSITLDNDAEGESLVQLFQDAYEDDDTAMWVGKMYFRLKGGSYGDPVLFNFTRQDVEYDEVANTFSIELQPYINDNKDETTEAFFATVGANAHIYEISVGGVIVSEAIIAGEFIQLVLHYIYTENPSFPAATTPIMSSNVFTADNVASGDEWFMTRSLDADDVATLYEAIGRLAACEGSLFGTALGKPFYVGRNTTEATYKVTLDSDNIEVLKKVFFFSSSYESVYVELAGGSAERTSIYNGSEKTLNIVFTVPRFTMLTATSTTTAIRSVNDDSIVNEGVSAYYKAFGFGGQTMARVKYWGIDGIYPYSVINFDASAPSVYQGKDFRIKTIEYDFPNDTVDMEIYQI